MWGKQQSHSYIHYCSQPNSKTYTIESSSDTVAFTAVSFSGNVFGKRPYNGWRGEDLSSEQKRTEAEDRALSEAATAQRHTERHSQEKQVQQISETERGR